MRGALKIMLVALTAVSIADIAMARPIVPAEKRFEDFSGTLPPCDDPSVLASITGRFEQSESEYWNSTLQIQTFDRFRSIGIRPWGLDHIPRTFCAARAQLNDKTFHAVVYSIAQDSGFIGIGNGVEWCVVGLNRNYSYAPDCKMAGP